MDEETKGWTLSIGIYPGFLIGIRTYEDLKYSTHVLYLPFLEFVLEIDKA